jgi:dTDP-4-amino-4,6-dideoxygalactose transaminase
MIPFNIPPYLGTELVNIQKSLENKKICGGGIFSAKCHQWLEQNTGALHALLTPSCTHALEMAAILANIEAGDEVIMPSYTFTSTANAFVLRKAHIVFVDIRPDTMNIDETLIEDAITPKTKAVIPMHYAGVGCEMDTILEIAGRYNMLVIEDAAQGIGSMYKDKMLGTIGDVGCYSFHETKNLSCGEGGAIIIQNKTLAERAEIIREKGTNRSQFLRGQIDKYTWVDIGSSYLPSELNAAYLYTQLENIDRINNCRMERWNQYYELLEPLAQKDLIVLPFIPDICKHNAHLFYIKLKNIMERDKLIAYLKKYDIQAVFHYIPLHSSPAGQRFGHFHGNDVWTTKESERLLRLPLFFNLDVLSVSKVCDTIHSYFLDPNL